MNKITVLLFTLTFIIISLTGNGTPFALSKHKIPPPSKYTLDKIEFNFKTTKSFDDDDLEDIMNLPKLQSYSERELEQDRLRIKKFYFDNGFFDAVVDTSTSYDNEDLSVIVTIIVIENNRYKLDKIKMFGLENIPPDLKQKINTDRLLKSGDYYNKSAIVSESGRIIGILQDNGYLYASLDTANGTVISKYQSSRPNLKYKVNITLTFMGTKKQYVFGKTSINIKDNKYGLQDYLIERELTYEEGKVYSRDALNKSERNLSKFSIIQSGRFNIDTVINDRVNIRVDITLTNKYEVTPNILALNDEAVNQFFAGAGIEYSDRNFFGGGRVFSVSLQGLVHNLNTYRAILNTSLYQPYFIRNNMTATYTLKFVYYNPEKAHQEIIVGNLLRVNYYIAEFTFYNSAYSDITIDLLREKKGDEYYRSRNIDTAASLFNSMNSILGLTLIHDNTNDIFNPSSGFYHSITVETAGLLPKMLSLINENIDYAQYFKLYMPNKFYFDVSGGRRSTIFATYNEIGDIIEYGKGENIIPIQSIYKFYSGGSSSLRGWNAKENGIVKDPSQGGNFLFEGSFEYRWNMFSSSQNFWKNFWSVYFVDYGNIWETDGDFRFSQIALATGLGLRYDTFVGPLRIDLGFKLYNPTAPEGDQWLFDNPKDIFKHKFALQFGLGNAF
jgi:outer membrane protein insertion porin family